MTGPKTNEREGTRAVLKYAGMSAYKARTVLDIIRGKSVQEAADILRFTERDVANHIGKLLASAVANAEHNDELDPEELFVSACYADEGVTMKRWRPRARGRAGRIRKRTCHITVIVSRLPDDKLARLRAKQAAEVGNRRARRVAGARAAGAGDRDSLRRRRRRGGEEAVASEPIEAAEEAGVVDPQAAEVAVASAEPEVEAAEIEAAVEDALAEPVTEEPATEEPTTTEDEGAVNTEEGDK